MSMPARGGRNRPLHLLAAVASRAGGCAQPARRRHDRRTQAETEASCPPAGARRYRAERRTWFCAAAAAAMAPRRAVGARACFYPVEGKRGSGAGELGGG
uniref:Uncharacterized protein n=1 Tax=Arundo donax TaxID=35708 RepID=A0A0A9FSI6_ARUDO